MMSVKHNIKRLRNIAELTQEDLATIAGVTRGAVSQWEIGESEPRMGAVQRIADHFHIKKSNIIEEGGMDGIVRGLGGRLYEIDKESPELSEDEWELIRLYRAANDQGRATILGVAQLQQGMERKVQVDKRAV